jgi:hypothetical protein
MKILILLFLTFAQFNGNKQLESLDGGPIVSSQTVYICKGPNSLRFHSNSSCRGLSSCSTQIYSVSIAEAKNIGRTACQICY